MLTGGNPAPLPLSSQLPAQLPAQGPAGQYDSERVVRKGWLTKDSGLKSLFMKSQKRWCVLKAGYFQYFHSESEDGRNEVISLGSMESVSIETKRSTPVLVIKTPQRSYMLTSSDKSSNASVFEWLQDITRVLTDAPTARRTAGASSMTMQVNILSNEYGAPATAHSQRVAVSPAGGAVNHSQAASRPAPMSYSRPLGPSDVQQRSVDQNCDYPAHLQPIPTLTRYDSDAISSAGGNSDYAPTSNTAGVAASHDGAQRHQYVPFTPAHPMHGTEAYDLYSSMYEHDALATRTGILISADVSPSMAAMAEPARPPLMHY
jgi:hypothetical protein